jgi:hypothetical protein
VFVSNQFPKYNSNDLFILPSHKKVGNLKIEKNQCIEFVMGFVQKLRRGKFKKGISKENYYSK